MNQDIKRNEIKETIKDEMILRFLSSYMNKACLFCHEENKEYLCRCKNCGYYFCNNIHRKTSHIVIHLKQCNHNKICLSPFHSEIRCEKCKETNILELKFLKSKGKLSILCNLCLEGKKNYTKIVDNKKINEEILLSPEVPPLANREDSFSESIIAQLNNKINAKKNLNIQSVSPNYNSKENYYKTYCHLIEEEINTIEKENDEDPFFIFNLKFTNLENGDNIAEITNSIQLSQNFQFYPRQLLIIAKADNEEKKCIGKVISKEKNKITIYIYYQDSKKTYTDGPFKIKEKETTKSYETMLKGLDEFNESKSHLMDENIESLILGLLKDNLSNINEYFKNVEIPTKLNILELNIRLNPSQIFSIKNCFKYKFNLIKGPPGTGKSTVLTVLAYHLVQLKKSNHKILICASSNRAVENISILLKKIKDLKFVRVLSREKELCDDVETINSLYNLAKQDIYSNPKKNEKIIKLIQKREKYGLKKSEEEEYKEHMEEFEQRIINSSDIILSTINNSADSRLKDYYFPIVIIDEATQSLEPDILLPLYHRAEMVVLIGDEKQLGPIVISREAEVAGFDISLFERLCYYYEGSNFITTLNEQYRMHEFLYRFSNDKFYNNQMISRTNNILDEKVMNYFPWPDKTIPSIFYHYTDLEENENNSYFNKTEINLIYSIVKKLISVGVDPYDIGIITPYNAQKFRLCEKFYLDNNYENLRIESVDGFQGMEKKYIIISTVRSNEEGYIGFLTSKKRLNVALTRAKNGLIILGNCQCLSKRAGIWRDLIDFYYSKKLIVKGPLSDLDFVKKGEILSKALINIKDNEGNIQRRERKYFKLIKPNKKEKKDDEQAAPPIKPIMNDNNIFNNLIIHNKNKINIINNNDNNKNEKKNEQIKEKQNVEKVKKNKNKKKHVIQEVEKEKGNKKYQNKMKSKKNKNKKDKEEDEKEEEDVKNEEIKDKKNKKKKNIKVKDEKKEKKNKKEK